jgi:hypothetical protein
MSCVHDEQTPTGDGGYALVDKRRLAELEALAASAARLKIQRQAANRKYYHRKSRDDEEFKQKLAERARSRQTKYWTDEAYREEVRANNRKYKQAQLDRQRSACVQSNQVKISEDEK